MTRFPNERTRFLVTGGFGFLGAAMTRRLVAAGHDVHLFVRRSSDPGRLADVLSMVTVHEEDLSDSNRLCRTVERIQPRGTFHFAAANVQGGQGAGDREALDTNVRGLATLLTALAGCDYDFFVNAGSFLEYGRKGRALRESDVPEPAGMYGISKLAGTLFAQAVGRRERRPVVTLRLMTPYGPGIQKGRLVHEVLRGALQGGPVRLTHPEVCRDFLFVDDFLDLCQAVASAAREHCGEIFNAGTGVPTTLAEVVETANRIAGTKIEVEWGAFRDVVYDDDRWCADMSKTHAAFPWRPSVSLEDGLRRTMEWMRRTGG